ncbi:uncharacterized protein (TIGR03083 family) [Lipingzhangella halophila]|uniref:Uncharacterized protein (TIGR03083 family) n=1 Tax=Lipingzhangella halophila TaxID=1783352 RepID=A0A7W7RFV3_9ACTN|nr:maleylpyruvate isomerase N-terminal domain-containing protein [Lipingzhangella halophila]MBB4931100.1 uncharacterized protein (TIGR03083 family) [Lipingzhangella halophila]
MNQGRVLDVFRCEAGELSRALTGVYGAEWERPTRCAPWSVRELLGHVRVATAWLPDMLAASPSVAAEVSAAEYYRPDDRYAPEANRDRIDLARAHVAAQPSDAALVDDFTATWEQVDRLCRAEPEDRVVRTRHGDVMLLSEFLLTRVVEVAVHGLDLADALGREPWLTPQAGDAVLGLLLGPNQEAAAQDLDWDHPEFLRKATGRAPVHEADAARLEQLGIRWLTTG